MARACCATWRHPCTFLSNSTFPSESKEETGRLTGISENVGNDMTFSILKITTSEVISMSNFRPAGDPASANLRIDPLTTPEVVKYRHLPSDHVEENEEAHAATK